MPAGRVLGSFIVEISVCPNCISLSVESIPELWERKNRVSKPMTAMERERLRIQTDLIGQENQHLVNTRDSGNVRQLRGHNIPIPTPLNLSDKSGPDSAG